MDGGTLQDLGIAVGAALLLSLVFYRIGLPMVSGQMLAGMLVGPFGFGLIRDTSTVDVLASLGIILLLFTLGLELDPRDLRRIGHRALILTTVEFLVAFTAGLASGLVLGWTFQQSLFLGAVLSISSSAVIGKMILDRQAAWGQTLTATVMAVLIIEDVVAIFLLLLAPEVASRGISASDLSFLALKGALLCTLTVAFGRFVAPRIINWVSQYELDVGEAAFLLAIFFAFLFGALSNFLGFSPAIGAFLIGLTLLGKHSRYVKEKIAPIKDLFIVFFFVSMGALVDVRTGLGVGLPLVMVIAGAIVGKMAGGSLGARLAGISSRSRIGIILIPRGEFTLILARVGVDTGLASPILYPVAGLTMLVTALAEPVYGRFLAPRRRVHS